MLKKFLAGLTALALSLGMVALTAGPASAHHSDVSATFTCSSPTAGTITWSVHNWKGDKVGRVWSSTGDIVPVGTLFDSDQTKTFAQPVTAAGTYNLSVTIRWYDGDGDPADLGNWNSENTNNGSIQLKAADFTACQPDDTSKEVPVCHYNGWQLGTYGPAVVSVSSVLNGTGHGGHSSDIIAPFDYVKQGVPGHYNGRNWSTAGQNIYNNACAYVTPVAPTFTPAQCVGPNSPGAYGQANYVIPVTNGVQYQTSPNGNSSWSNIAAGQYFVAANSNVYVRAVAKSGFELAGDDNQWKWPKDFDAPDCDVTVTPTKPASTQPLCIAEGQIGSGSYTIPTITGVRYEKWNSGNNTWSTVAPGTYPMADGTSIWIRAVALTGYELAGSHHAYKWEFKFDGPRASKCQVPKAPTPAYQQCTGPGTSGPASYLIPTDGGIQYQRWNGSTWINISAQTVAVVAFPLQVKIRAVGTDGNIIVPGSITEWTFDFVSAGPCLVTVTPGAATHTQPQCTPTNPGVPGQGGYTLPTPIPTGVVYTVKINGGASFPGTAGFHPLGVGDVVTITASASAGYQLAAGTWTWGPWTITAPSDPNASCDYPAPVEPVVAVNQKCVVDDLDTGDHHYVTGTITIPSTPHVTYSVNGSVVGTGTHDYVPGVYTISAEAAFGYYLTGVPDPWTVEVKKAPACGLPTFPSVIPKVTFVQTTCSASGSYTLIVEPAIEAAGVIWTVTGGLPTTVGKHVVNAAGTVTVTAKPAAGYGFGDGIPGPAIREWSFGFTSLPTDCLPTLALSGSSVATSGLGLAGLLTLGGILMISAHRRRAVVIEG